MRTRRTAEHNRLRAAARQRTLTELQLRHREEYDEIYHAEMHRLGLAHRHRLDIEQVREEAREALA